MARRTNIEDERRKSVFDLFPSAGETKLDQHNTELLQQWIEHADKFSLHDNLYI